MFWGRIPAPLSPGAAAGLGFPRNTQIETCFARGFQPLDSMFGCKVPRSVTQVVSLLPTGMVRGPRWEVLRGVQGTGIVFTRSGENFCPWQLQHCSSVVEIDVFTQGGWMSPCSGVSQRVKVACRVPGPRPDMGWPLCPLCCTFLHGNNRLDWFGDTNLQVKSS